MSFYRYANFRLSAGSCAKKTNVRTARTAVLGTQRFKKKNANRRFSYTKIWKPSTRLVHNFLNIDPFLMIFAPFERGDRELSNGAKIIKNGSILRKSKGNFVWIHIYFGIYFLGILGFLGG